MLPIPEGGGARARAGWLVADTTPDSYNNNGPLQHGFLSSLLSLISSEPPFFPLLGSKGPLLQSSAPHPPPSSPSCHDLLEVLRILGLASLNMVRACLHGSQKLTLRFPRPLTFDVPILFLFGKPITLHLRLCPLSLQLESASMRNIYLKSHRDTDNATTQQLGPKTRWPKISAPNSAPKLDARPPNSAPKLDARPPNSNLTSKLPNSQYSNSLAYSAFQIQTRDAEKENCRSALSSTPLAGLFTTASPPRIIPLRTPRTPQQAKWTTIRQQCGDDAEVCLPHGCLVTLSASLPRAKNGLAGR